MDSVSALEHKLTKLRHDITRLGSVAIAFSGGTDSTFLLAVCLDVLGTDRTLALTADSPLMPRAELDTARQLAHSLYARHVVLTVDDLNHPEIVANRPDRCYHCKLARFKMLVAEAGRHGLAQLLHGENADDVADYRPGSRAAEELGVRAPLREAGLAKSDVRALARERGLSNWDQPANACLASRIPYGTPLTGTALSRTEAAEQFLRRGWGLKQFRVRDHHPVARLEVLPDDIARLAQPQVRSEILQHLRELGYHYVSLDLEGYRMGSLNDELERNDHF